MTLVDLVVSASLAALVSSIAVPMMQVSRDDRAARIAARYVANRFQHARFEALKRNAVVAIRFDPDDLDRFGVYVDGDGDGVLESDVRRGADVLIGAESRLSDFTGAVGLRINQDVPEPETGVPLVSGSDPLRVGRSTLVSFSPIGSATSGTVYLSGASGPQMAVRILGATGRMRVLRFDVAGRQWREQ